MLLCVIYLLSHAAVRGTVAMQVNLRSGKRMAKIKELNCRDHLNFGMFYRSLIEFSVSAIVVLQIDTNTIFPDP